MAQWKTEAKLVGTLEKQHRRQHISYYSDQAMIIYEALKKSLDLIIL